MNVAVALITGVLTQVIPIRHGDGRRASFAMPVAMKVDSLSLVAASGLRNSNVIGVGRFWPL